MVDLIELRAEDFRAFRQVSVSLDPNGLVLVAGPNNAGKSALLSVLDVVASTEVDAITARHAAGSQARVWARWQLSEAERRALLGDHEKTDELIQRGATSLLEWHFGELQGRMQPIAVSGNWLDGGQVVFAHIEDRGSGGWAMSTALGQPLAAWDGKSLQSRTQSQGSIGDSLPFFPSGPAVDLLTRWRQGYFHFRPLRESQGRDAQLSNIRPILQSTGANLATVLLRLHNNQPDVWHQLVRLVQEIVPGVGLLMTIVDGDRCSIVFQDEQVPTHRHNLKDLGTGVEQLLMTLVVGLTQNATTVVMEEPETGLHPGAQRALLSLLQSWSKDRLFVASTHSATMLDWSSPNTTVLSVSRHGSESTVVPVTTERADLLQGLGVRLSDVLSAERILILEGRTDKEILDVWFPEVTGNPRVAVLTGEGGYNAVHADRLAEWLTKADELGQRQVLYIRDRDELSAKFLEKLEQSKYVQVLPVRELENLLLDFDAVARIINTELAAQGKPEVASADVSMAAKKAADKLKSVVILKRVMADLAEPIRLVDHNMRARLGKKSAEEAKAALITDVLARVPEKEGVEKQIEASWTAHSQVVEASWENTWLLDAPGADLLKALFMKFLERGYSKAVDGVALAQAIGDPPETLRRVIKTFTADEDDSKS